VWLEGVIIAPYENQGYSRPDPARPRKLLLRKKEIARIRAHLEEKGLTLVPLSMFINARGLAKVELGVGRGLKRYDKREKIREREEGRQVARVMRHSY
jgi:SsrA-binding protein